MGSDECATAPASVRFTLTNPTCKTKAVIWGTLTDKPGCTQTRAVLGLINRHVQACTVHALCLEQFFGRDNTNVAATFMFLQHLSEVASEGS